jgi:hypothetical protein
MGISMKVGTNPEASGTPAIELDGNALVPERSRARKRKPKATHLLKPGPINDLQMLCGLPMKGAPKGHYIGTEGMLEHVDCIGCLRALVYAMRRKSYGHQPNISEPAWEWLCAGECGISSVTIWHVMTGYPHMPGDWGPPSYPRDPDDFGRCHRLLEKFPEWRARLGEVAAKYPAWQGLVAEWDALTALYLEEFPTGEAPKLYARMKELTDR